MKLETRLKRLEQSYQSTKSNQITVRFVNDDDDCDVRKPECPVGQYPKCTRNKNCWSRLAGNEIIFVGLRDDDED